MNIYQKITKLLFKIIIMTKVNLIIDKRLLSANCNSVICNFNKLLIVKLKNQRIEFL